MPKAHITPRQKMFIQYYLQSGNATQAYIQAGFAPKTARQSAQRLMSNSYIYQEIQRLQREEFTKNVATSEEVMDFFSRVMRGEVLDQFGLETSVADRIKAAQELAKRTVDIDNRIKGAGDNVIEIKLDWGEKGIGECVPEPGSPEVGSESIPESPVTF